MIGGGSARLAALCVLTWLSLGCGKGVSQQRAPGSSATPEPSGAASSAPALVASDGSAALPALRAPLPPPPICRALRVVGDAKVGDAALVSGAELDGSEWVALAAGASVALKHALSGRELLVKGPALFRACRRGREQLLLAKGSVVTAAGMGSRPGAEVLIATPVAGIRYGDAELTLLLDAQKLSIRVRTGQVEVDPGASTQPVKSPISSQRELRIPLGKPDPARLMARCKEAAEAAEASARRVVDKSALEPLGERAKAHVQARKAARAACTIAAAATGLVADPVARAGLWAEAVRWEGLWESIPRPGPAQAPEK
jgi:hypothetical protein